jgi:DNA/RNA-binding domain of Phe-tRNA-synthetase-like protein
MRRRCGCARTGGNDPRYDVSRKHEDGSRTMTDVAQNDTTHFRLMVDPEVERRFPTYSVLVVYAYGLANGPSDDASIADLRDAEEAARAAFGEQKASTHPHIAAWRQAFGAFGSKPSKYLCSAEALLSRVLKGQELPAINRIVDHYNAVSVRRVLPAGGEDLDKLTSDLSLTVATGGEPFDAAGGDGAQIEHADPGEIVWADTAGVTCRRWNWRQGVRTRLIPETRNAYFVLDRLEPFGLDALDAAGQELIAALRATSPGVRIETELLGSQT